MSIITLFGLGQTGKSLAVTAQSHLNLYCEVNPQGDKGTTTFYGTPGLILFESFGETPIRGILGIGDLIYVVHRGTLWKLDNSGVKTMLGTLLTSSGRVSMTYNGVQLAITDGTGYYVYVLTQTPQPIQSITNVGTTATLNTTSPHLRYTGETVTISGATPAAYNGTFQITVVDADTFTYTMLSNPGGNATVVGSYTVTSSFITVTSNLIGTPIDITFGDGYGILAYANGQFQKTSAYDFTTLDALDFATAESNPDGLVRDLYDHGELILFGTNTVEFWSNTGGQDFPYSNQRGTTLQYGLAAKWSLVQYNDSIAALFKNAMGQVQVMRMAGHALQVISTPEIDYIINKYSTKSDATAYCYMLGGHPMLQINFPSQQKSWLYDGLTQMWSPLESGLNGDRHRGEIIIDYLNSPRVTDYSNGNIYTLDADTYTDNGVPIPREIVTKTVYTGLNKRIAVHRLGVDCQTGNGLINGQGSNPQIMLQVSKDSGRTWSSELWVSMGKIGEYVRRAYWTCLGSSYFWTFKFRITDPVPVVLTFTDADSEVRN
jgi:hypothetical protein